MFRDLCSCHKNKKKKNADDDDLPYSPKKHTTFFGFKKNTVIDKTLTSTPNQLIQVRKLTEEDNFSMMDVQNNNNDKFSKSSINNSPANQNSINHHSMNRSDAFTNSSIEKDSNDLNLVLDSKDELNRSIENRSSDQRSIRQNNHQSSANDDLNEINDKFSNLLSKSGNDHQYLSDNSSNENVLNSNLHSSPPTDRNKLTIKTDSTNDLSSNQSPNSISSNHLTPINCFDSKSTNNLNSLESNNGLVRPNGRNSFTDSTDNILISDSHFGMHRLEPKKNFMENEDVINLLNSNVLKYASNHHSQVNKDKLANDQQLSKPSNKDTGKEAKDDLNGDNRILNLINVPTNTINLKRVSSDDKIDNSSIESVVLDKQTNEIVRRSTNQFQTSGDDQSIQSKHPNSILIQETITLTLKRGDDKKSLNEFSMENLPKQLFETSSFAKEYFYDEPIIKTSSKFMNPDFTTYKMQSDPRGLCLIINNATTTQSCLRLKNGFVKEVNYFKDIFTKLGFSVEIHSNVNAAAICKLMKNLKNKIDFENHDAFVCVYFGHGNQHYVVGEDNFKLNLELMIGCMNNYHCPKLINKPKVFIVHTCNSSCQTFLEPIAPSNIPREVQALKKIADFKIIPTWTDTAVIYSPFENCNLYYSPFVKEFGLSLCNNAFELSLHDILMRTNDQMSKKSSYNGQCGVDINYRGLNKSLFFNPGHFFSTDSVNDDVNLST